MDSSKVLSSSIEVKGGFSEIMEMFKLRSILITQKSSVTLSSGLKQRSMLW